MAYIFVFCVLLCWCICFSCVLHVICVGVVTILLLNVMAVFSLVWVEVLYWIDSVWSSKECVCSACDPSVHPTVPSIGLVYVVCGKLSPHLRV